MIPEDIIKTLTVKTESKIVLLILDGLGGLPVDGRTELEAARAPNLDALAAKSACGLVDPISPGITPGSGPSHMAIFGYDPLKYQIGRGSLEAMGLGFDLKEQDVAARGNFTTLDLLGFIIDRRAGRISSSENNGLCEKLQQNIQKIDGVKIYIVPGREHRFALILRGEGLKGNIWDTDPQKAGEKPREALANSPEAQKTAHIVNQFVQKAREVLKDHPMANMILLRGFSEYPRIPNITEFFKLNPAAIATYPMYKGLAKLVGMEVLKTGDTISEQFKTLKENFHRYDFFYLHVKSTDTYGEDGNFAKKVAVIEEVDNFIPELLELSPEVLAVTSDHSTPALLKAHSWHPSPFLLYSRYIIPDEVKSFSEGQCAKGILGRFSAVEAMPLMLANALKMKKFGA